MALLYGLPTLLEWKLAPRWGIMPTLLFGNIFGCAIVAYFDWERGAALYSVLSAFEWALLRGAIVGPRGVILLSHVVPAAIVSMFVVLIAGFTLDLLQILEPGTRRSVPGMLRSSVFRSRVL